MRKLKIPFVCVPGKEVKIESVGLALQEFSRALAEDPVCIGVSFVEIRGDARTRIKRTIMAKADGQVPRFLTFRLQIPKTLSRARSLLVFCPVQSPLSQSLRSANPKAVWGAEVDGTAKVPATAYVWRAPDKFIAWHEAAHLLGAEDCYDRDGKQTCDFPGCLMQWEPTKRTIKGHPYFCKQNINRIRAARASS